MNKRVDHFNAAATLSAPLTLMGFTERADNACSNKQATDCWTHSSTVVPTLAKNQTRNPVRKTALKKRLVWERPVGPELNQVNLGALNSGPNKPSLLNPDLISQRTAPLNASFGSQNRAINKSTSKPMDRSAPRVPLPLPLMGCSVAAGFPSPAEDWIEGSLDLNSHLIPRPSSTFLFRVSGTSMINAGIMAGALLVVDRAIEPRHGAIVVAHINGELTVKRLFKRGSITRLDAENPAFPPLIFKEDEEISIWGVVSHAVTSF